MEQAGTGEYVNSRLHEINIELCAEMLVLGELVTNVTEGKEKLQSVLDNVKAAEVFGNMVTALGGPADFVENYDNDLAKAGIIRPVYAASPGIVQSMDTRALGMTVVSMGGGRRRASDNIDYAVGLSDIIALGEEAGQRKPLAVIHVRRVVVC